MDKIIEAFKDFDFGVAFSSLSGEQIIMALLGFIISIFAGFFFGGAIFYALGVKSGKKAAKKKKTNLWKVASLGKLWKKPVF